MLQLITYLSVHIGSCPQLAANDSHDKQNPSNRQCYRPPSCFPCSCRIGGRVSLPPTIGTHPVTETWRNWQVARYPVRAHVSQRTQPVAQELEALENVTLIQGSLEDNELVAALFAGAHKAFINTISWGDEVAIGKSLADAAKKAHVQHYVYSSMPDHSVFGKGWPAVPLWSCKFTVENYMWVLLIYPRLWQADGVTVHRRQVREDIGRLETTPVLIPGTSNLRSVSLLPLSTQASTTTTSPVFPCLSSAWLYSPTVASSGRPLLIPT